MSRQRLIHSERRKNIETKSKNANYSSETINQGADNHKSQSKSKDYKYRKNKISQIVDFFKYWVLKFKKNKKK